MTYLQGTKVNTILITIPTPHAGEMLSVSQFDAKFIYLCKTENISL